MGQEYIKGDIVMYDNKIHTIMDTLELNNYELSYIEHPVHQLELSGVPLTPEILEKNGWKKKMYCDWCHYLPIEGNILYLSKGVGIDGAFSVDVGQDMSYIASISFVHQLQHLLFGLRLNSEMEVQVWQSEQSKKRQQMARKDIVYKSILCLEFLAGGVQ